MGRYEAKRDFWEIDLVGRSLTTTTGRISSGIGTTTSARHKDEAAALAAYLKAIEAKTRKSYRMVRAKPLVATRKLALGDKTSEITLDGKTVRVEPGKTVAHDSEQTALVAYNKLIAALVTKGFVESEPRDAGLEAAIVADPYDTTAYSVLADWLQDCGDPRGELIALQVAGKDSAARELLATGASAFLGPLAEHANCYDNLYWRPSPPAFLWRNGFIHALRISNNRHLEDAYPGDIAEVLELVLRHPSGRFVTELALQDNGSGSDSTLQSVIDRLAKLAPPTLRKLVIGDQVDQISWYRVGDLGKLWRAVPQLRVLEIEAGEFALGKLELPELRRAVLETGGLSIANGKAIATAAWPRIEHLEIYFGDSQYGGECKLSHVRPLLERTDLKSLTYLGLCNSEFADELCGALPRAKIVKQLRELDLSCGLMTDEGAQTLAANKAAFAHLEVLDVSDNYLSSIGVRALQGVAKRVVTEQQKDDEGDPEMRWVSVGE